ncbi:hypothetical protein Pvag_pPag30421 (plasmid) [Pantoea vagans C9-1]|nr:hypothetical protein Pvag_pPag30421 [Pantoea vagans C9-1]
MTLAPNGQADPSMLKKADAGPDEASYGQFYRTYTR